MKTLSLRKEDAQHDWFIVDASDKILGRLATKIADRIRGKDKPTYTPHTDGGDYVVVINAEKIKLSGNKWSDKSYIRHTGYPGGQRSLSATELYSKDPARLVEKSVKGMLPKNKLGSALFRNLSVFVGASHSHEDKKPQTINLNDIN